MTTNSKDYQTLIEKAKRGFTGLPCSDVFKQKALDYLAIWLKDEMYEIYFSYIIYLVKMEKWELLLDSFYKVMTFGTGGRRGLVGVGPNRINVCTVKASAQGYSQYLIRRFGKITQEKGVVLAYDVRESIFDGIEKASSYEFKNKVSSFQLAKAAASVYAANNIKVFIFSSPRSTPQLSFSVKHLNAIGGCVFSASHNAPQYNGEKFYDCNGCQILPPYDEDIFYEIYRNVKKIKEVDIEEAIARRIIRLIDNELDKFYYNMIRSVAFSKERGIKILYSPLHGTGVSSVFPSLKQLGFDVYLDDKTSNLSGDFENVIFNMPNPELEQSFDLLIENAKLCNADIIITTDPDADRLGVMVRHKNNWIFLCGNQIGIILSEYALTNINNLKTMKNRPLIIKTAVTTSLISEIANRNGADCIDNLLVGFKYIGDIINRLEKIGLENKFLLGVEESHGYLVGTYCRDKDASGAAVWICELAARLKKNNFTLIDYIEKIYSFYGYCDNYTTEIELVGIDGVEQIDKIMIHFRNERILNIGVFKVITKLDGWDGAPHPHLSDSDTAARNMITFVMKNLCITRLIKLIIRPSGTEPKLKIYIEVLGFPFNLSDIENVKAKIIDIRKTLERGFLKKSCFITGLSLL